MNKLFICICALLFTINCRADEKDEYISSIIEGLSYKNYPTTDGSDSTTPLRTILMCKLLEVPYIWSNRSLFLPPEEAPNFVLPLFSWIVPKRTVGDILLCNNTHPSLVNLIDGKVELTITARNLSRDEVVYANEKGVEILEKPIAQDALTFMVNLKNPIENLSTEQIQGIYTGKYTNWQEVGGKNEKIVPFIRNRNSGSQEKFETMVMKDLQILNVPEMQIGTGMDAPYSQLEHEPKGISFTPYYFYDVVIASDKTKAIGIDGIAMTKENIVNGSYPYITNVYASVRADIDRNSLAYKIFEFLTTEQGQNIVAESGYVPLKKGNDTSVKDIAPPFSLHQSDRTYDLSGKQVSTPKHGQIHIKDGNKILNK